MTGKEPVTETDLAASPSVTTSMKGSTGERLQMSTSLHAQSESISTGIPRIASRKVEHGVKPPPAFSSLCIESSRERAVSRMDGT